jgi:hypothetical protein
MGLRKTFASLPLYDEKDMVTLRTLVSPLLEARVASPLRRNLALWRAARDSRGTLSSAELRGFAVLSETDLLPPTSPSRTSELFILGSGPSVLDLTPEHFSRMRQGTTIGVNSWVLHDFIPDAYSFEEMENDDYSAVAEGLSQALRHKNVLAAGPLILHLRPRLATPASLLVAIPTELKPKTRYYGRFLPETRRITNLTGDLVDLIQAQVQGLIPPHTLLDGGFSIARIVSLGIARGFSSIVLVGVDLNTNRYFFEEDPSHLARHGLTDFNPWISRTSSHDTEQTEDRNFAASEFLAALARASETIGGPTLSVLSSSSKLAESLPLYQ